MLAGEVIAAAKARGDILVTAESCTGGMVAAALTDIAGSSAAFDRGFVTYSNAAKQDMLGVDANTLSAYGAVSPETASEMARGALVHSTGTLSVAITGIAGPGGSDFKPEGRVCFALAQTGKPVRTDVQDFGAPGREAVRTAAKDHALRLLLNALQD